MHLWVGKTKSVNFLTRLSQSACCVQGISSRWLTPASFARYLLQLWCCTYETFLFQTQMFPRTAVATHTMMIWPACLNLHRCGERRTSPGEKHDLLWLLCLQVNILEFYCQKQTTGNLPSFFRTTERTSHTIKTGWKQKITITILHHIR